MQKPLSSDYHSMHLSSAHRKKLKGIAHKLKPVVIIGKNGLTESVLLEAETALDVHELIKIKIVADREMRKELTETLISKLQAELVQTFGQISTFYRRKKKPKINLNA